MLVLFGAPVTHEDDPRRAVRAALAIRDALVTLERRWRRNSILGQRSIEQRMGIAWGQAFAGQVGVSTRREYTVMGDEVNLAARLMAAATPGQILVSEPVHAAAGRHFRLSPLPPVRVKGKAEPIPIFQVDGRLDDRLASRLANRGPLLGWEAEMQHCQLALEGAMGGRETGLRIEGPAGVGKSRLTDALIAVALEQGVRVVLCECQSYSSNVPYAAWTTLLGVLAGTRPTDPASLCGEKLARLLGELELTTDEELLALYTLLGLQSVIPERVLPIGIGSTPREDGRSLFVALQRQLDEGEVEAGAGIWGLAQERQVTRCDPGEGTWGRLGERVTNLEQERLFAAIGQLLGRLAARGPLLVVFEDAHWMDPVSRTLIDHLLGSPSGLPLLILSVQRSEEDGPAGDEQTIVLRPLKAAAVREMLAAEGLSEEVVGSEWDALVDGVYRCSGGNPLYIEELIHWMHRSGVKDPTAMEDGLRTSATLQELLLSRMDNLPPSQQEVARAASIVGETVGVQDLVPLLEGKVETEHLDYALAGLEAAGVMLPAASGPERRYAFRQTLVREMIYDSLSFARRRELHGRMAAQLEILFTGDLEEQAELLAYHFERADQPLPAARHLLASANSARRRYAYEQAAGIFDRVVEMLERIPAAESSAEGQALVVQAYEGRGDVAVLGGDFTSAAAAYDAAASILTQRPLQKTDRARLEVKRALVLPTQGRTGEALSCAERALAIVSPADKPMTATILSWLRGRGGDEQAAEWIERARSLAAAGDDSRMIDITALLDDLASEW